MSTICSTAGSALVWCRPTAVPPRRRHHGSWLRALRRERGLGAALEVRLTGREPEVVLALQRREDVCFSGLDIAGLPHWTNIVVISTYPMAL